MILKNGFIYKNAYIEEVDISSGANFGSVKFFLQGARTDAPQFTTADDIIAIAAAGQLVIPGGSTSGSGMPGTGAPGGGYYPRN
ncbi:hypothetical protein J2T18_000777 [Paenibacillus polymyxa]|uniref:hypothetical protein n=1 Tax=Paenibacillus polymyxa TaxID=1406 RepID=UPI00278F6FA3|nr:hypothetical protein [Paenibacillus polymyxa]MDQ0046505.1 hypothetical protein [Paenibacillus polymyxa]